MTASTTPSARPASGVGRVLVVVYAILALAATGRSFYQIVSKFDEAPVAYSLSALAAVVYILATVALVVPGESWRRVAIATIGFELVGVLVVGVLSLAVPELFGHASVWSYFGMGYLFIPLVLPILGLLWLTRGSRGARPADAGRTAAEDVRSA
jgi:NhaP-type Na+/H+ and K+/H+ antiporter